MPDPAEETASSNSDSSRSSGARGEQQNLITNDRPRSHFSLPPPDPMNVKSGNEADNWKYFEEDWENWSTATKLDTESPAVILAALKIVKTPRG